MENSYCTLDKLDRYHLNSVKKLNILSDPVIYIDMLSSQILHDEKGTSNPLYAFLKVTTAHSDQKKNDRLYIHSSRL